MCKYKQGWGKIQSIAFLIAGSQKVLWLKIGCTSLNPTHEINPEHATTACGRKTFIWCLNFVQCTCFHDWPSLSTLRCFCATVLLKYQRIRKKETWVDVNTFEVFQTSWHPLGFFIFLTADLLIPISVLCTLPTDEDTKQRLTQFRLSATTACVTVRAMGESSQTAGHSSASWASLGGLVLRIPADITAGSIK